MRTGPKENESAAGAVPNAFAPDEAVRKIGEQFIASLHHDIRTPLSGIMGMIDLLLETELSDEQKEFVHTARLCADQLLEMLNSALEYAALSAGGIQLESAEFHLHRALEELVREFEPKAAAKGLRLTAEFAPDVPEFVIGDEMRLRQAVAPLLANAVKFTQRGRVSLEVAAPEAPADGRVKVSIAVRDTGPGIPSAHLKTIFESFRQIERGLSRSHPGLGLGLALVEKLAMKLGAELDVESAPGAGSTFVLTVPFALPADAAPAAVAESPPVEESRPRILFVDDNEVARRVVSHILQRAGYAVDCAEGGREGILAAERTRYQLVLMDLQMPEVNGVDAARAIRNLPGYESVPIVALTANYSDEFIRQYGEAGFGGFLSKPIQREELVAAVKRYVDGR